MEAKRQEPDTQTGDCDVWEHIVGRVELDPDLGFA